MSRLRNAGERWLPRGKHHGMYIDHRPTGRGGRMVRSANKIVLHTTEGEDFWSMDRVLRGKSAEPHFLFGRDPHGNFHIVQYIPLNQGSRALEHPSGTMETNNAGAIQIELVGYAVNPLARRPDGKRRVDFDEAFYEHLSRLILMIQNRVAVPAKRPRMFLVHSHRYSQRGWLDASGIVGHGHAASQPSGHWDPGRIRGRHLVKLVKADKHNIKGRRC